MSKIKQFIQFLKEVKGELEKVSWPSRDEVVNFTIVVIVTVVIVAFYLGLIDYGLSHGINYLLAR